MQLLISLQSKIIEFLVFLELYNFTLLGLILVAEPYFNEPVFEREKNSSLGDKKSLEYNQMAVIKVVDHMKNIIKNPPECFKQDVKEYLDNNLKS